jgi:hypothetical protein
MDGTKAIGGDPLELVHRLWTNRRDLCFLKGERGFQRESGVL